MVEDFAATIDVSNSNVILQYGAAARKRSPDSPRMRCRTCAPRIWVKSER